MDRASGLLRAQNRMGRPGVDLRPAGADVSEHHNSMSEVGAAVSRHMGTRSRDHPATGRGPRSPWTELFLPETENSPPISEKVKVSFVLGMRVRDKPSINSVEVDLGVAGIESLV